MLLVVGVLAGAVVVVAVVAVVHVVVVVAVVVLFCANFSSFEGGA